METCNSIIRALDNISIAEILSYLRISDILHLSLTCKDFYRIVSKSPYIIRSLFGNLFGRKIAKKDTSNLTYARFHEILKDLFLANTLHKPLPFFGFRGNCGCDRNNPKYLFDKIFEFKEEGSVVCTNYGENFDIEGVLSENYGTGTKFLQDIISAIDQTDEAENPDGLSLKDLIQAHGSAVIDLLLPNPNNLIEEKIQSFREFIRELSPSLKDQSGQYKYNIELPCQKMTKSVGLIQSCHFKRRIEHFTCPVKTLVAFASLNEEIRMSSFPSLFNDCKTSDDLIQLLNNHKEDLPSINQTSIKKVAELSPNIKYIDEEKDEVEFVVFKSNGKKEDVIPLFWVNFNKLIHKDLFLYFKDCSFSGRYVMLKLIQCEDLRDEEDALQNPTNIDMAFCCFYGPVIDL